MGTIQRWDQRHARIVDFVARDSVRTARSQALDAAQQLIHDDDLAASALAANRASQRAIDADSSAEQLSIEVDESLAVLYSAPKDVKLEDPCLARREAKPSLVEIASTHLTDSSRDLFTLVSLESNSLGTVEVVRCRMDRKIYVLKSMTKGAARRCYKTTSPMTERRLLAAAREQRERAFAPKLVASFQSPASLHILLEYCPAGDLYNFLESAGQADETNEARNPSGGLLAERYIRSYARDMVAAIAWLHDCGFMHRDIKPGNWLFDRSGHLLLCDLASAAPFSTFSNIPSSANLAELDAALAPVVQRRILYRHCTLVGTADYIAPEVFWAAEMLGARASRLQDSTRFEETTLEEGSRRKGDEDEDDDDDEPPPDGPGPHGPECDWWSVGVVLFEMTYKRLPFFAKGVAQTYDMIKNHERYFHLDEWVQCSSELKDLLCRLITGPQQRLGAKSSQEIQFHPYFAHVDWTKPWESEAAPFIPNLDSFSVGASSSQMQEISVLHSPGPNSPYRRRAEDQSASSPSQLSRPDFAAMWAGNASDFPAFPNSVELSPRGAFSMPETAAEVSEEMKDDYGDESSRTITSSSPSTRAYIQAASQIDDGNGESKATLEAQWGNFDPLWIGFSYVPDEDAFAAVAEEKKVGFASPDRAAPPLSSPVIDEDDAESLLSPELFAEEWNWQQSNNAPPCASTPYVKTNEPQPIPPPTPLPMPMSTPYHGAIARSLHRHAMETASRAKTGFDAEGRPFVTPLRKDSLSGGGGATSASVHFRTPAPVFDLSDKTPASPYPFPVAQTISRPKATPAPISTLRRNDLDRARSASASYGATSGEGSDSRCSGGTNAKRDISEREAWKEMEAAVLRSVRKPRQSAEQAAMLQATADGSVALRRPPMVHAATDTLLQRQDHRNKVLKGVDGAEGSETGIDEDPGARPQGRGRLMRKASAFGFGGLGGALKAAKRPQLPRFLSDRTSKAEQKHVRLAPPERSSSRSPVKRPDSRASTVDIISSPASSTRSEVTAVSSSTVESSQASPSSSSRLRLFPQRQKSSSSSTASSAVEAPLTSAATTAATSSLAVPAMPKLYKRRSARQLLIKAQERATPTRPARVMSPLIAVPISLEAQTERSADVVVGSNSVPTPPAASGSTSSLPLLGGASNQLVGPNVRRGRSMTDADNSAAGLEPPPPPPPPPPSSLYNGVMSSLFASRSPGRMARMPPSAPVAPQVTALQREEATRTIRRRDSREMLSRYRQGIVTSEDEDDEVAGEDAKKTITAKKLPPGLLRHQPSFSTQSAGGGGTSGLVSAGTSTIALSSPSLPTFPDAFGGAPPPITAAESSGAAAAQAIEANPRPRSASPNTILPPARASGSLGRNSGKPLRRSSMNPLIGPARPDLMSTTKVSSLSLLQQQQGQASSNAVGLRTRASMDFASVRDKRENALRTSARRPFEKTNSYDAKALAARRRGLLGGGVYNEGGEGESEGPERRRGSIHSHPNGPLLASKSTTTNVLSMQDRAVSLVPQKGTYILEQVKPIESDTKRREEGFASGKEGTKGHFGGEGGGEEEEENGEGQDVGNESGILGGMELRHQRLQTDIDGVEDRMARLRLMLSSE